MKKLVLLLGATLFSAAAQAMILYGADNNATTSAESAPSGLPFGNVATIYNYSESGGKYVVAGSAVYLDNGYFITANHVAVNAQTQFSFDGTNLYSINNLYTPTQIGGTDLKIFNSDASILDTLSAAQILTSNLSVNSTVYFVGSGYGRNATSELEATSVAYGGTASIDVRWGMNKISYSGTSDTEGDNTMYYQTTASTQSASGLGTTNYIYEAQLTTFDSGSAMFASRTSFSLQDGFQTTWYLTGVAVSVGSHDETINPVSFGATSAESDISTFINLAQYADTINTITSRPAPQIPEPADIATAFGIITLTFTLAFRRRK